MLLHLDLETTGLDPKKNRIVEIAWRLTTDDLIDSFVEASALVGPAITEDEFAEMDDAVKRMHTENSLFEQHAKAISAMSTIDEYEDDILTQIDRYAEPSEPVILTGSSPQFDRSFIEQHMPRLADRLHYRMFDVSTIRRFMKLCDPWNPAVSVTPVSHRALSDVRRQFNELLTYRALVKKALAK